MCMSVSLCLCRLYASLPASHVLCVYRCLSVYMSVSVSLCVCECACLYLGVSPCLCMSVFLCVSLCVYGCVCVHVLGESPCMYMTMSLCTSLDVSPCLCLCVISVSLCSMSPSLFVGVSMMCLASAWVYVSCLWWTGAGTGLPSTPLRPVCDCHMTMVTAVSQSPG